MPAIIDFQMNKSIQCCYRTCFGGLSSGGGVGHFSYKLAFSTFPNKFSYIILISVFLFFRILTYSFGDTFPVTSNLNWFILKFDSI